MTTRTEHLQWCKDRAKEYIDRGDLSNALASFFSDMGKHDETRDHPFLGVGAMMMTSCRDSDEMWKFIDGFN